MKVQTISVVTGTMACNAHCPFCVSKMTPTQGVENRPEFNYRNMDKAFRFARDSGVSTLLITGKGEPTLYPDEISRIIFSGSEKFPFIELQTNGIKLADDNMNDSLSEWYQNGLTTIILSVVHWEDKLNRQIYGDDYPNLENLIEKLHRIGFSVRLNCIMVKGYIEGPKSLVSLIDFCKDNKVEQLTVRPVTVPETSEDKQVYYWTYEHRIYIFSDVREYIKSYGYLLMTLMHGAEIYDFKGQNICMSNCLTESSNAEEIRQLIYFPDGHLRFSWQYPGAIIF
jgi:molybdenum cofactor biosynthesis enzyme MoaA